MKQAMRNPGVLVGLVALFIALQGPAQARDAYTAASRAIKGSKIKKNSIPADRIKNNSLGGRQINESRLATVPKARAADTATTAGSAATAGSALTAGNATTADRAKAADTATNADRAGSAGALDGHTRFLKRGAMSSGADFTAAREGAAKVLLFEGGPFKVYGKCFKDNSGPDFNEYFYVETTANGSVFEGDEDELDGDPAYLDATTAEIEREIDQQSTLTVNSTAFQGEGDSESSFTAPDGSVLLLNVAHGLKNGNPPGGNGAFGAGDGCLWFGEATFFKG